MGTSGSAVCSARSLPFSSSSITFHARLRALRRESGQRCLNALPAFLVEDVERPRDAQDSMLREAGGLRPEERRPVEVRKVRPAGPAALLVQLGRVETMLQACEERCDDALDDLFS